MKKLLIFILVDPTKKFAEARNERRWSDASLIFEAALKYASDRDGTVPVGLDDDANTAQVLGAKASGCDFGCSAKKTLSSCLDLSSVLIGSSLSKIPYDPQSGSSAFTDYYINKLADGRIEVGACDPELGIAIYVSR